MTRISYFRAQSLLVLFGRNVLSPEPEAPLLTSREDVACTLAALSDRQRFAFSGKKVKTTTYAVIYARRPHNGLEIKSFQINQTRPARSRRLFPAARLVAQLLHKCVRSPPTSPRQPLFLNGTLRGPTCDLSACPQPNPL